MEPRVPNPQTGADLRRGDIKVHQGGTTWILDIGVVCPGTQRYVDQGSQTTPGRAADVPVYRYGLSRGFVYVYVPYHMVPYHWYHWYGTMVLINTLSTYVHNVHHGQWYQWCMCTLASYS